MSSNLQNLKKKKKSELKFGYGGGKSLEYTSS